jgi:hypothetical protein
MHLPIIVPDDDLKNLEKRFGPGVRNMGPWNSDGVFSYSSIPIVVVEEAAESMNDPMIAEAVIRLKQAPERTKPFLELVHSSGPALIEKIVAAYRERSLGPLLHGVAER